MRRPSISTPARRCGRGDRGPGLPLSTRPRLRIPVAPSPRGAGQAAGPRKGSWLSALVCRFPGSYRRAVAGGASNREVVQAMAIPSSVLTS